MSQPERTAYSLHPSANVTQRFAMAGDDLALHFDLESLNQKQADDHLANQLLTGMLQVALLAISKPGDEVALYEGFQDSPWHGYLNSYHEMYRTLGLNPIPIGSCSYHPMEGYYESVAAAETKTDADNLYMISGSNECLHQNRTALEISRNLNSKIHFFQHAPEFAVPIPSTCLTTPADLDSTTVAEFTESHGFPMMLKTLGLAGARCVFAVESLAEAQALCAEYPIDMSILLQARLAQEDYQEMTVDLLVSDTDIHITNVRQILFANNVWVGNLLGPEVQIQPQDQEELLRLGEYARKFGYTHPLGVNCGVDYFVRKEGADPALPPLLVTEINARWTGGLFPAEVLQKLNRQNKTAVAIMDAVPVDSFAEYVEFQQSALEPADFSMVPLGFCPQPMPIDGTDYLYTWQIVTGSFDQFLERLSSQLPEAVLPAARQIVFS